MLWRDGCNGNLDGCGAVRKDFHVSILTGGSEMKKRYRITVLMLLWVFLTVTGCEKSDSASDPNVELGDYSDLEVTVEKGTVTEENVISYINRMLEYNLGYAMTDKKTVEMGDFVRLDYEGLVDGEEIPNGSATNVVLEMGARNVMEGFDESICGREAGSEFQVNLKFPDPNPSNPDLSGKKIVFQVRLRGIVQKVEMTYEDLTDEYVKEHMQDQGYTSVSDLKDAVSEYLNGTNDYYAENNTRAAVVEKLTEICSVKEVDADILQQRVSEYEKQFKESCKTQYNMEFEEYLEMYQMTEEDFHKQSAETMEENLKEEMILLAIGKKEGIELDEKKYAEFVETMMQNYQYETENELYDAFGRDYIENACMCNQILTMLVEKATVTYVAPGKMD